MSHKENQPLQMPEWLLENENYIPLQDKDTFVDKSILSVLHLTSKIKMQDAVTKKDCPVTVFLALLGTLLLLILLSLSKSYIFILLIILYLLILLSTMETKPMVMILKASLIVTCFTAVIMLPAFLGGNTYSSIMITTKVFASITTIGILSQSVKWNSITEALKFFHVPDLLIFILDITIKYIYMLGEFTLQMFYALKLRSVGRNNKKYTSVGGIAGTVFLESKEMADEMYHAMECRGFCGDYHVNQKIRFGWMDMFFVFLHVGFIILFIYFGKV